MQNASWNLEEAEEFVPRGDNVIDFAQYRARRVPDPVSFQWQREGFAWNAPEEPEEDEEPCAVAAPVREPSRPRFHCTLPDLLEAAATAATLVLLVTVWIQFVL